MECKILLELVLWTVFFISDGVALRCYDCAETFKVKWDPYTDCQANVSAVPVATCLDTDQYCKVERVSVKGATISITRSCAGDCYYGCSLNGFGVTQLRCSTCCNETLCNTGSGARSGLRDFDLTSLTARLAMGLCALALMWTQG